MILADIPKGAGGIFESEKHPNLNNPNLTHVGDVLQFLFRNRILKYDLK